MRSVSGQSIWGSVRRQIEETRHLGRTLGSSRVQLELRRRWRRGTARDAALRQGVIHRVPSDGGAAVPVTEPTRLAAMSAQVPHFLPDGRRFLFLAVNREAGASTVQLSERTRRPRALWSGGVAAAYVRQVSVFARKVSGRAAFRRGSARGDWGSSDGSRIRAIDRWSALRVLCIHHGRLVYALQVVRWRTNWFGRLRRRDRDDSSGPFHSFWLASDGVRAVIERGSVCSGGDRGTSARFTSDAPVEGHPVWSPMARESRIFQATSEPAHCTSGPPPGLPGRDLGGTSNYKQPTDWSPDGR
jgi:hypothetical protein